MSKTTSQRLVTYCYCKCQSVVFEHSRNFTIIFVVEFTKPPSIEMVEFRCLKKAIPIEKNTDIRIKCFKCGNEYSMDMMRIGPESKNLVCRECLERKSAQKQETKSSQQGKSSKEEPMKEYFCKECKYNFKRAKHLAISACPYCGASGSLMVKGSTARIIADAAKMKGVD